MLKKSNMLDNVLVESAATSYEESGEPIYYMAADTLTRHGISGFEHKRARRTNKSDYQKYDLIICMDKANISSVYSIYGGDPENKVKLLMDYTTEKGKSVSDPWYTRNFETTYLDIYKGCKELLKYL